jgi:oxygen-independent coproporphyrinogen III oxidase
MPNPSFIADALAGVTPDFLARYDASIPRYTSYPTAPTWSDTYTADHWLASLSEAYADHTPLSLYTHLPFCEHRCLFCGCNVVITQQREQAEKYLGYLLPDSDRLANQVDTSRPVVQYHWGGGTPTYLSVDQMQRVFRHHTSRFTFAPDAEISIEVDPRVTTDDQLQALRELGFNRISLGVQDFNVTVQQAIERLQSEEQTWAIMSEARRLGFTGINFDLIYGLPHQTVAQFEDTLDTVIQMAPDRLAVYNFAYLPTKLPHQTVIDATTLPTGPEKFAIFTAAVQKLMAAGYVYIGMDHFAKPTDELAMALQNRSLHRNFMGYTTKAGTSLLGFGVSAISSLPGAYSQNHHKLSQYYQAVDAAVLPTCRGMSLSADDQQRRDMIQQLLCQSELSFTDDAGHTLKESLWQHNLPRFEALAADGLLTLEQRDGLHGITLTPLGRVFSRNVAACLDAYLPNQQVQFSRSL